MKTTECSDCDGNGYTWEYADCWSDSRQEHYTDDYQLKCEECNGDGEVGE